MQLGDVLNVDVFDVPPTKHPPVRPLVNGIVEELGRLEIHEMVRALGAVIVGNAAGLTVIVLDTDVSGLPHTSVAVHVSVTVPPHAPAGV